MATRIFTIAGVVRSLIPGWSHHATLNGMDGFDGAVISNDGSYRPALDDAVIASELVVVVGSSVASPTVLSTLEKHGIITGQTVTIAGHVGSTPAINGTYLATRLSPTTFSIPVNVTIGGSGGTVARRMFAGTIIKPYEHGLGNCGITPITTEISVNDYKATASRLYVNTTLIASTLKARLTTLAALCGFTLDASQTVGPALDARVCDYQLLSDVLDAESVITGYVWEFTEWNTVRMYLPNTEVAPFDVIDGDGHAVGDITVEPTRTNYANRVIVRWMAAAVKAYGFLVATGNFANGETVVLGSQTYTFRTVLGVTAGDVLIGLTTDDSLFHLTCAITKAGGGGSTYAAATVENAAATALLDFYFGFAYRSIRAIAIAPGAAGNSIACTETAANAGWRGNPATPPITSLEQGSDASLTNVAQAPNPALEPTAEQTAHGVWEIIVQSPETTTQAAADLLAASLLAVYVLVPKTVIYSTYELGIRPGQTQTITIAHRNVNGTFLVTDVETRDEIGKNVGVKRTVTAIESLLLQSADRWRDTYKQWSGGSGGSGTTVGSAGSASAASLTTITDDVATNAIMYPAWVSASTGNLPLYASSTKLQFNPSTGLLTATGFSGPLTGNVTGNASGTAVTVTGAAQAAITSAVNLVSVGTLTTGATGAGFTIALTTSTVTGTLADARLSANVPLLNAANSFTLINPLTTLAESWIGPTALTGIYFKAGNVGIGTTGPSQKLEINGNLAFSGAAVIYTLASDLSLTPVGNVIATKDLFAQVNLKHSAASDFVITVDSNQAMLFSTNATERMRILNTGNVGIGTTGPTAVLHLKAGTATAGTAPLKLTAGINLTTPELGAIEFVDNGTTGHLYITQNVGGVLTRVQVV